MKNIKFKKRKHISKAAIAVACVVVTAVIVAVGFIAAKKLMSKEKEPQQQTGYSFDTKNFENISEVKSLNGKMAVFTDSESGKKGLMTFGGKVTEKAEHNNFLVGSDVWRNYRYIVDSPASEYPLLADAATGTVTSRQSHGLTEPELIPCWSEAGKHLAWTDETGYAGQIKPGELKIIPGFYPVATSLKADAKYGYINQNLRLEIAAVYENAMDFSGDLAAVKKDGKWGYINKGGVTVIPFDFDSCASADVMGADCAFGFVSGLAPVCKNGKFGVINEKGETVVDFSFDSILQGENGIFIASKEGKWGLISVDKKYLEVETTVSADSDASGGEPAIARGQYMVKTSGSVLNMRSLADPYSSVVAKIPNGTVLTVTKAVTGWAFVKYNSFSGWVSSDFLVEAPEETTIQNTTNLTTTV